MAKCECGDCPNESIVEIEVMSETETIEKLPICQDDLNAVIAQGENCETLLSDLVAYLAPLRGGSNLTAEQLAGVRKLLSEADEMLQEPGGDGEEEEEEQEEEIEEEEEEEEEEDAKD